MIFSPTKGLLKIGAIGKDIDTNTSGDQLIEEFNAIMRALTTAYGDGELLDNLKFDSIWKKSEDWTMSVIQKDRTLDCYWGVSKGHPAQPLPEHLSSIALEALVLDRTKGWLHLSYEFEGWNAFVDELKARENSVL